MTTSRLTIGTAAGHNGVLRRGRTTLYTCGHQHTNRDQSTGINGVSARDCITTLVKVVRNPAAADAHHARARENIDTAIRRQQATATTAAAWRAKTEQNIQAFDAAVATLHSLIGDEPVYGYNDHVVIAPPAPEAPCPACGITLRPANWVSVSGKWWAWAPVQHSIFADPPRCTNGNYRHPQPTLTTTN